jgi:exodeoxyribonuclease VII large subunit
MPADRPLFDPDKMKPPKAEEAPAVGLITVGQLTAMIKRALSDRLPETIHLVGEISNVVRARSGHLYLTIKDEQSEIRAVMWRSGTSTLKFKPTDGLQIMATGNVDVYSPRGQYQFYIRKLEPRGIGELELAFRQLRERLEKEGLFDPEYKKQIPSFPRRIAVVTSATGAAIRDILQTLRRRFPCVSVMLHPVRVQGDGAAEEIAAAIKRLNQQAERLGGFDVMIVGRGGGSLEDLWAFNEEIVARAIFASNIPVISGVGHEVDVSISDLVADLRAPTPTAAAELAVPVLSDVLELLNNQHVRLTRNIQHVMELAANRLDGLSKAALFRDPLALINQKQQQLDECNSRLQWACGKRLGDSRQRLHCSELALVGVQPGAVIRKRYHQLTEAAYGLRNAMQRRQQAANNRVDRHENALQRVSPLHRVQFEQEKIRQLSHHLQQAVNYRLRYAEQVLQGYNARLQATSYRRTLQRGFTITRRKDDQQIIQHAHEPKIGDVVTTETADGAFTSRVTPAEENK